MSRGVLLGVQVCGSGLVVWSAGQLVYYDLVTFWGFWFLGLCFVLLCVYDCF